jgi:hypothetical protein
MRPTPCYLSGVNGQSSDDTAVWEALWLVGGFGETQGGAAVPRLLQAFPTNVG